MIPEGFISNLLDRADITDVIGRYVPLKKAGRNMMACCPFHKEKSPSFSVSPSKQIYKCFGCGVSGNAIGFLMAHEGLEFPEAVRKLAGMYGMDVPEDKSPAKVRARQKARTLVDYMNEAAGFYTASLVNAPSVIDYLKRRRISGETARRFALGYSPEGWHALQEVFEDKYGENALVECGLVNEKNGRRYDAYRGRLMFPIRNARGDTIGFGARTLNGDEQPKYINSPETPIYHKGSELYGFFEGRDAIYKKERAIVCEGYMDVIQLAQAGFEESVAALGTSITPEHVRKLFKISNAVYFSFDGDAAGRKAARRALEATLPVISDVQKAGFILLPPEHDPDSLIKDQGPEAFEAQIQKAFPLTTFMKHLLLEGKDLTYAEERAKIVAEARPWILSMNNAPIMRLAVIRELAGLTRLTPDDIERQYGLVKAAPPPAAGAARFGNRSRFSRDRYDRRRAPHEPRIAVKDVRERMLQCFLAYPPLFSEFSGAIEEEFVDSDHPVARLIIEAWRLSLGDDDQTTATTAALLLKLSASPSIEYYRSLLGEELRIETPVAGARQELNRCFLDLEYERTNARIETMAQAGSSDVKILRALVERREDLRRRLQEDKVREKQYRLDSDRQAQYVDAKASPVAFSSNPAVRRLQEHLYGKAAAVTAPEPDVKAPVQPERPAAQIARALDASRAAQAVPDPVPLSATTSANEDVPDDGLICVDDMNYDDAMPIVDFDNFDPRREKA